MCGIGIDSRMPDHQILEARYLTRCLQHFDLAIFSLQFCKSSRCSQNESGSGPTDLTSPPRQASKALSMCSPTSFADTRLQSTPLRLDLSVRNYFWTVRRKSRSSRSAAWRRLSGSVSQTISQMSSTSWPDPMADGSTLRYFGQTASSPKQNL